METLSSSQFAALYGLSDRTVRNYCRQGRIVGAFLTGKTWNIPADSLPPERKKKRPSPLLKVLRQQKDGKVKGGIYHRVQIDLTYNSNHIEGSKLTKDQTRMIFETRTVVAQEGSAVRVDDIIETVNHFHCVDYIIDHAPDQLTEGLIKQLHRILKTGTVDSTKDWFIVGDYKRLPNEVDLTGNTRCIEDERNDSTNLRCQLIDEPCKHQAQQIGNRACHGCENQRIAASQKENIIVKKQTNVIVHTDENRHF